MKMFFINVFKSIMFVIIFFALFYLFTYLTIPKYNVKDFRLTDIANYDILSEEPDTIDVIALGDSLIYASVIPMEIYGAYGYTVFNCSDAAQILPTTIKNLELAIKSQHPKMVLLEASVFYRDERKADFGKKVINRLRKYTSLIQTHNNWKKLLTRKTNSAKWVNIEKGYKFNSDIKAGERDKYMAYTDEKQKFPYKNLEYFNQIVQMCEENNVKLVLMGFPSQYSWNYKRHNYVSELAEERGIEYINLNLNNELGIDWKIDSKDGGIHLNYTGAKKVSKYVGEYLKSTGLFKDHRKDKKYEAWNIAYKSHLKSLSENQAKLS